MDLPVQAKCLPRSQEVYSKGVQLTSDLGNCSFRAYIEHSLAKDFGTCHKSLWD